MWKYVCPICNKNIMENYEIETIKEHIGATHDCPECNGLLMIEEDLTCSDFGNELVNRYKEIGVNVTKEQATGTYIDC